MVPETVPGRHLAWLMNLQAEPSSREIRDHLDVSEQASQDRDLASGLLAFGRKVRELPGVVTESDDRLLRLELNQGAQVLRGVVSMGPDGNGKVGEIDLRARPADEVESDRVRLLYDRAAGTYEQAAAPLAHYWDRARTWLRAATCDGFAVLDVGCGPGHLVADLPASVNVLGCDLSPEMIRLAALARPTGTFVVHDYHEPFPAHWPLADVTIALGCLEFCSDLARVTRNLATATKPGGRLLVTVPRAEPRSRQVILHRQLEISLHLWEDTEVAAALGASSLDVIAHDVAPGFTSSGIGTVQYGYWELKARSADIR